MIGVVAGLATGRPVFALLGLILGHQFDKGFRARFSGERPGGESQRIDTLPEGFVRALFQTAGFLAKADGRVTEDEIRAARALMHRLGLGPAQIRAAIGWFEDGKSQSFPLLATARQVSRDTSRRPELRSLFVRLVMEISLSKTSLHQRERAIIWTLCKELDIGRVELAQLEAMLRAQHRFRKSPEGDVDAKRVAHAYRILGVDKSSTNAEIKTSYRRLMNRNHPDKIAGHNPDAVELAEAERKTREIRGAYEMLKVRRTIR